MSSDVALVLGTWLFVLTFALIFVARCTWVRMKRLVVRQLDLEAHINQLERLVIKLEIAFDKWVQEHIAKNV